MAEKLLEADLLNFDFRAITNRMQGNSVQAAEEATDEPEETISTEDLPAKEDWAAWSKLLADRLKTNATNATGKVSEQTIEAKFFKEFFIVNWGDEVGKKLDAFGDPLKRAIKILKIDPAKNPILNFITKQFTIALISAGKLNADRFRAIYNAVANKLVASSEFMRAVLANEYNIIYCPALYEKTAKDIEAYLTLQSESLSASSANYSVADQDNNKKIFLQTKEITETNAKKRADLIKSNPLPADIQSVSKATLNSIELAKLIMGKEDKKEKATLDSAGQDKVIEQVKDSVAKIFATLLSLNISTGSEKAGKALTSSVFSGLKAPEVAEASRWLAANNIIVKGELRGTDADSLVDKLLAAASTTK